jgi:hypothetical protein
VRRLALILTTGAFAVAVHRLVLGFLSPARLLPAGVRGDQSFYLWALERAMRTRGYARYVMNCDWSSTSCFDLRAVPQEWNNLFLVATTGRLLHFDALQTIFSWYLLSLFGNAVAVVFFVATVIRTPGASASSDPDARRRWLVAAAVAPMCAFQQSVLARLGGHFSLVAIWPLVFALAFFWRSLEAVFFEERALAPNVAGLVASIAATLLTSFYYSGFALVLFPVVFLAFVQIRSPRSVLRGVSAGGVRRLVLATLAVVIGTGLSLYPVRYVLPGAGARHAASFERSGVDVQYFSAEWADFVRPSPRSAVFRTLEGVGWRVGRPPAWRGEVVSFLGLSFLVSVVSAVSVLVARWRQPGWTAIAREPAFVFLAAGVIVAFFATVQGGLLLHTILTPLRCFSRLAPFVTLMGAALVARVLGSTRHWRIIAAVIFASILVETSTHGTLTGRTSLPTSQVEPVVAKFTSVCRTTHLYLSPSVPDYMFGPFVIYYVAERAGCRLSGVYGPGETSLANQPPDDRPAAVLQWDRSDLYHPPLILKVPGEPRYDLRQIF